jgi:hypothetical protein
MMLLMMERLDRWQHRGEQDKAPGATCPASGIAAPLTRQRFDGSSMERVAINRRQSIIVCTWTRKHPVRVYVSARSRRRFQNIQRVDWMVMGLIAIFGVAVCGKNTTVTAKCKRKERDFFFPPFVPFKLH